MRAVSEVLYLEFIVPVSTKGNYITIASVSERISAGACRLNPGLRISRPCFVVVPVGELEERVQTASAFAIPMRSVRDRSTFEWRSFSLPFRGSVWSGRMPAFPHWLPAVMCAICPSIALARHCYRRHRGLAIGLYSGCGYDLTGNVSGTCPECGGRLLPAEEPVPGGPSTSPRSEPGQAGQQQR